LFLYQVLRSAAWTNQSIPRQSQPGESPAPLLPLNLWYLLTAYGRDDDATQPFGHQLLGRAMSVLNDYPILSPDDIRSATTASLPRADLDKQIERVRITLQPLSVEDISKLWTGFATQYRLSAAYEISVALIESTLPAKTPLPVLTRGKGDQGVVRCRLPIRQEASRASIWATRSLWSENISTEPTSASFSIILSGRRRCRSRFLRVQRRRRPGYRSRSHIHRPSGPRDFTRCR